MNKYKDNIDEILTNFEEKVQDPNIIIKLTNTGIKFVIENNEHTKRTIQESFEDLKSVIKTEEEE